MLHLHCLVWLCSIYYLAELYNQLQSNPIYNAKIAKFINNIIYYLIVNITSSEDIKSDTPSVNQDKIDEDSALKLYKDNNAVVSKTLIYLSLHNIICFKYKIAVTRKYCFDFLYPCINKTKVIKLGFINIF